MDQSFYEILGVEPGAGAHEIEAAYRDRKDGPESQWVQAAYDVLSKEDERKLYDYCLQTGADYAQEAVALQLMGKSESEVRRAELEKVAEEARQAWAMRQAARQRRAAEEAEWAERGGDRLWWIQKRIEELDQTIAWDVASNPGDYFDQVLYGERTPQAFQLSLKLVERITVEEIQSLLNHVEALIAMAGSEVEMELLQPYLVVGDAIDDADQVRGLVEAFNQRVWQPDEIGVPRAYLAYTVRGKGTRAPGVIGPQPRLERLRLHDEDPKAAPTAGTVLLVDDDPLVLEMITDLLEPRGYVVHHAQDWTGFREALTEIDVEAVVLDVHMPNLTGDKMAAYVKHFYPDLTPRVVFHSGMPERDLRRLARRLGASNYLCKGSPDDKLVRVIEAAVLDYRADRDANG